jgi:hypothetical protein
MPPLGIAAVGAVTAVGEDASATVGSIFTEAQSFRRLPTASPEGRSLMGAVVPMGDDVKGVDRLVMLGVTAIKEATRVVPPDTEIGLVACVSPEADVANPEDRAPAFLTRLASEAGITIEPEVCRVLCASNLPILDALTVAEATLYSRDLPAVCVVGVDSLSTQPRLGKILRMAASEGRFVPGEAAAALLLTRQLGPDSLAILAGTGTSEISPTSTMRSRPATGSVAAIDRAVSCAELAGQPVTAMVHDLPCTQAGDEELAWLQGSPSFVVAPAMCILSPVLSVGEIGTASGILSIATLAFLMEKRESDGPGLCLFASTNGSRGAAVLKPAKRKHARH